APAGSDWARAGRAATVKAAPMSNARIMVFLLVWRADCSPLRERRSGPAGADSVRLNRWLGAVGAFVPIRRAPLIRPPLRSGHRHSSIALMAFSPPIVPQARLAKGRLEVPQGEKGIPWL